MRPQWVSRTVASDYCLFRGAFSRQDCDSRRMNAPLLRLPPADPAGPRPAIAVRCQTVAWFTGWLWGVTLTGAAAGWDPAAADFNGRQGATLYVSKQGDNSDGSSWTKAFHSIQAALSAVPDERGGHRVIVRPDSYSEANLAPVFRGASGAYNALIGDFDGRLGSGARGWVLADSGDPVKGLKSWDWWSSFAASDRNWPGGNNRQTFSSLACDRWIFRNLYVAGGDAGLFWDLTDRSGEGFTVVVEDCVGTGRAFGGGVCYPTVRAGEPSVFRRCYFLALDWVGDTAAVLLGGWEKTMPAEPHAVFEDCTMVHPDNAVGLSYASYCARAKFIRCRMIALNFTQPEMGAKSTGILCTEKHRLEGRLHVDLEDCTLAGYSVFTPGKDAAAVSHTTKGRVEAYVQFKQPDIAGFERLGQWPAALFAEMAPPRTPEDLKGVEPAAGRPSPLRRAQPRAGPARLRSRSPRTRASRARAGVRGGPRRRCGSYPPR